MGEAVVGAEGVVLTVASVGSGRGAAHEGSDGSTMGSCGPANRVYA